MHFVSFVIGDFSPAAQLVLKSEGRKMKNESYAALKMTVKINNDPTTIFVYGKKGLEGKAEIIAKGDTKIPNFKLVIAKKGDVDSGTVALEKGEYTLICDVPGHSNMGATLTVE